MIENKEKFLKTKNIFYNDRKKITQSQKKLFNLIENKNIDKLVNKIIKEMTKENPKFKIRSPFIQALFTKLYYLFYR